MCRFSFALAAYYNILVYDKLEHADECSYVLKVNG